MPNFLNELIERHSIRKEIPATPQRSNKNTPKIVKKPIPSIRREPLKRSYDAATGDVYEENHACDEIIVTDDDFNLIDDVQQMRVESVVTVDPREDPVFSLCPFVIGQLAANATAETDALLNKRVADALVARPDFDFSTINTLISSNSEELRLIGMGFCGLLKMIKAQSEKILREKPEKCTSDCKCLFTPSNSYKYEEISVPNLENTGLISVNAFIGELVAGAGSLRMLTLTLARHWLRRIVPSDQLHRFSASQFPQYPQISFPAALINSPVALFLKCLDAPGIEPSRLEVTVSSIFKAHLDNVFAAARSKIVKRCRTGDAEQPSTSA